MKLLLIALAVGTVSTSFAGKLSRSTVGQHINEVDQINTRVLEAIESFENYGEQSDLERLIESMDDFNMIASDALVDAKHEPVDRLNMTDGWDLKDSVIGKSKNILLKLENKKRPELDRVMNRMKKNSTSHEFTFKLNMMVASAVNLIKNSTELHKESPELYSVEQVKPLNKLLLNIHMRISSTMDYTSEQFVKVKDTFNNLLESHQQEIEDLDNITKNKLGYKQTIAVQLYDIISLVDIKIGDVSISTPMNLQPEELGVIKSQSSVPMPDLNLGVITNQDI